MKGLLMVLTLFLLLLGSILFLFLPKDLNLIGAALIFFGLSLSFPIGAWGLPLRQKRKNRTYQAILEAITCQGWNIYYRGKPDSKIDTRETYKRGPVESLEKGLLYVILPKVNNPTEKNTVDSFIEKHQVEPKITVPLSESYRFLGRIVYPNTEPKIEDLLRSGEEISFIGFELQEKEVRLLAPLKTFIPYDVFLEALKTLQDINILEKF